jgi:hypothetical protein
MPDTAINRENARYVLRLSRSHLNKIKTNPFYHQPHCKVNIIGDEVCIGYSITEFINCYPDILAQETTYNYFDNPYFARSDPAVNLDFTINGKLGDKKNALRENAREYFSIYDTPQIDKILPDSLETPSSIITQLIDENQGVCIGEVHEHKSPKKLLIDNMEQLKAHGVDFLFLEHVYDDTHRELLEEYFESESNQMPARLSNYLSALDKGNKLEYKETPYTFKGLVIAAKMAGIKIIPVDTSVSHEKDKFKLDYEGGTKARCNMMNYIAAKQFEKHMENFSDSKYIFFVGSSHINSVNSGVLGIGEITGCPTIVVEDVTEDNYTRDASEHLAKPDLLLQINPRISEIALTIEELTRQENERLKHFKKQSPPVKICEEDDDLSSDESLFQFSRDNLSSDEELLQFSRDYSINDVCLHGAAANVETITISELREEDSTREQFQDMINNPIWDKKGLFGMKTPKGIKQLQNLLNENNPSYQDVQDLVKTRKNKRKTRNKMTSQIYNTIKSETSFKGCMKKIKTNKRFAKVFNSEGSIHPEHAAQSPTLIFKRRHHSCIVNIKESTVENTQRNVSQKRR